MLGISLSSLMLFTLQGKSLIHLFTYINYTLSLYLRILELSLTRALSILLNFGIALLILTDILTWLLTKKPNNSILILSSLINYHGTLARKKNVIQFYKIGKCHFKLQITKKITFWI